MNKFGGHSGSHTLIKMRGRFNSFYESNSETAASAESGHFQIRENCPAPADCCSLGRGVLSFQMLIELSVVDAAGVSRANVFKKLSVRRLNSNS